MKSAFSAILLLTLFFSGCTTSSKPVGGGYYLQTTHYLSFEPPGSSESLYFRGPHGRAKVWKNFTGPLLVEGGTALFVGTTQPGEYELLAVENGGTCFAVGKPILALQAERKSTGVSAFLAEHQIFTWSLKQLTNGFEFEYSQRHGVNNPHLHSTLTWTELSTIMHRVEAEGRPQKDSSGFSYLQLDYAEKR